LGEFLVIFLQLILRLHKIVHETAQTKKVCYR